MIPRAPTGLLVALSATLVVAAVLAPTAGANAVVSLTFDDGSTGQHQVRAPLAARGMHATFYLNSNTIGGGGTGSQARMSWQQVADLAADGNEIGGHTLDHTDLTAVSTVEARRQICDDRTALQSRGYDPVSFAYPFGAFNATVKGLVAECGYASARSFTEGTPALQGVETLPPADPYATRTVVSVNSITSPLTLQSYVQQAEASDGWVQFVFHRVCGPGCDVFDAIQLGKLTDFLDWLAPRAAQGTVVKSVREALNAGPPPPPPPPDTTAPSSAIACNGTACAASPYSGPVSVGLTASDTGGSGVAAIRYTTDGSDPTAASPVYSAPFTVASTETVKYRAWDNAGNAEAVRSQQIQVTPPPPPGPTTVSLTFDDGSAGQYQVRAPLAARGMHATFYVNSNTIGSGATGSQARMSWQQVADLATDGNEIGGHTLDHANLTAVSTTEARRQICDDRTALQSRGYDPVSFAYPNGAFNATVQGLVAECGYASARSFTGGAPPLQGIETLPPSDPYATRTVVDANSTTSLAAMQGYVLQAEANGGGWVQLVFHRVCGPGCDVFDAIQLGKLTDFLDWLAPRAATNDTTVKTVRQALGLGASPPPPPPDTTAPASTIACNGAACSLAPYAAPVSVSLAASDTGGSGVAAIRYTTNGSDPTTSSPAYSTPFTVASTTTVKYRAWDDAGNAEAVRSQAIQVSAPPPPPPTGETVVSLTFDDGSPGQYLLRGPLAAHGMRATFYVNSNQIGGGGTGSQARMSWQQVTDLAADGNEIGGHSLDHADLTAVSTTEARRQICNDRTALQTRGYEVTSFAYPFGAFNATVKGLVAECGYSSARSFTEGAPPLQGIETLPPVDAFATRSVLSANSVTSLATMQSYVQQAEANGGGWVQFVFHRVCGPGCDVFDAIQLGKLTDFLDWLAPRAAQGTTVKTVHAATHP